MSQEGGRIKIVAKEEIVGKGNNSTEPHRKLMNNIVIMVVRLGGGRKGASCEEVLCLPGLKI